MDVATQIADVNTTSFNVEIVYQPIEAATAELRSALREAALKTGSREVREATVPVRDPLDYPMVSISLVSKGPAGTDEGEELLLLRSACPELAEPLAQVRERFPQVPLRIRTYVGGRRRSYPFHFSDPPEEVRKGVEALARNASVGRAPLQGWDRRTQRWINLK